MDKHPKFIDGYFGHPALAGCLRIYAREFRSFRAVVLALLNAGRRRFVWMPKYRCDSMLTPVESRGKGNPCIIWRRIPLRAVDFGGADV